ncbi:MAG: GNAT family N-acetyltransferase [Candidatus Thorarchaeota archaeon]
MSWKLKQMVREMIVWTSNDRTPLYDLFASHELVGTMLMPWIRMGLGTIHVDSMSTPRVGLFTISIMNFIAGDSQSYEAIHVIRDFPSLNMLFVPDRSWATLVRSTWGDKTKVQQRTRMDASYLDIKQLECLKESLSSEYSLERIDINTLQNADPSMLETLNLFFESFDEYLEQGFGYCIRHEGKIVSMAYSCFPFEKDFEIQVNTINSERYRKRGLATIVCAALIEHGLKLGYVPQWDAANPVSVKLALKLGYTNPKPYDVFFWIESPQQK